MAKAERGWEKDTYTLRAAPCVAQCCFKTHPPGKPSPAERIGHEIVSSVETRLFTDKVHKISELSVRCGLSTDKNCFWKSSVNPYRFSGTMGVFVHGAALPPRLPKVP